MINNRITFNESARRGKNADRTVQDCLETIREDIDQNRFDNAFRDLVGLCQDGLSQNSVRAVNNVIDVFEELNRAVHAENDECLVSIQKGCDRLSLSLKQLLNTKSSPSIIDLMR